MLSRLLCFCCLFLGLYSCQEEDSTILNTGKLSFQMGVDTTLVGSSSTRASNILELSGFDDPDSYKVVISQDSGVVAEYARFDKMPAEIELEAGAYSVEVSKGTKTAAAFNSPYFYGKQDFTIVKDMTTPVEVTAAMENSRVTVDFSDDFVATYKDYTLSFMTNKMTLPLVYEKGEYRPMYFQADASGTKLTIGMELVNVYGKDVQYTATTTIKQKQWTKLTVRTDEKGLNGVAIDVVLNDETKETIYVKIGIPDFMEKLKGAPYIHCDEFQWDDTNVDQGTDGSCSCDKNDCTASACVDITAGGKINQVLLTVTDDAQNALINQYDLANLTPEQAAELKEEYGFVMPEEGIKGKVSASIELKSIIASLPGKASGDSHYKLSLTVVDALPESKRTTKEVDIRVPEVGESSITWGTAFPDGGEFEYGAFTQGDQNVVIDVPTGIETATISIDGLGITKQDIKSLNIEGITIEESSTLKIQLKFTQDWFNSLSFGDGDSQAYTVTFDIVDKLGASVSGNTKSFTVKKPVFAWAEGNSVDAFAKYACLKIQTNHPEKVTLYGNDQLIDPENVVTLENPETLGVVTFVWKNLIPTTTYTISAKYNNDDKLELDPKVFTTEEASYLGDIGKLEKWEAKGVNYDGEGYDIDDNNWGTGQYPNPPYRSWEKWNVIGWETKNSITTQYGGENSKRFTAFDNKSWTRYVANSGTIRTEGCDGYGALLRTVGWGKNNTAPGKFIGIEFGSKCEEVTPGELFLGNIDNKIPKYGMAFDSRPYGFKFSYKYIPKNPSDYFEASIVVLDISGNIIAQNTEKGMANSAWTNFSVKLLDYESVKAASMYIVIKSSGNEACQSVNEENLNYPPFNNMSEGEYVGSQLYIDDVELIYDYE